MKTLTENANFAVVLHLSCDITLYIPAYIRYKHHDEPAVKTELEAFCRRLGGEFVYLEEIDNDIIG